MTEQNNKVKTSKLPWILVGILLLVLIGGGTYAFYSLKSGQTAAQNQQTQQTGRGNFQRNPAMQAATEILRLQSNPQMVLNDDQKSKIRPVLQDLINTANPTQDILQQKADAINNVLTDQQKNFLAENQRNFPGSNFNGNRNDNQNTKGNQNANGGFPRLSGQNGGQNNGARQPSAIYQQALDAIK